MKIQHNLPAITAVRQHGMRIARISRSIERLSTGRRINRAGDDPAGMVISQKMRAQIRGLGKSKDAAELALLETQAHEAALQNQTNLL